MSMASCYRGLGRATPLKTRKPLRTRKRLNPISPKRLEELKREYPIRLALIKRCGGRPLVRELPVNVNGQRVMITTAICLGGVCEICGKPTQFGDTLEPHEKLPRSRGGQMSLQNSVMCHRECHMREHGIKVKSNGL